MSADYRVKPIEPSSTKLDYGERAFDAPKPAVIPQPPFDPVVGPSPALATAPPPLADADSLSHQVELDRAAATIVYRIVDSRTKLVVGQFPDENRLRARAYLRAEDNAKRDQTALKTDRRV